jgi:hypothetical protein
MDSHRACVPWGRPCTASLLETPAKQTTNRLVCRRGGDGATKRRSDTQATGRGAHRYRVAGMHATQPVRTYMECHTCELTSTPVVATAVPTAHATRTIALNCSAKPTSRCGQMRSPKRQQRDKNSSETPRHNASRARRRMIAQDLFNHIGSQHQRELVTEISVTLCVVGNERQPCAAVLPGNAP